MTTASALIASDAGDLAQNIDEHTGAEINAFEWDSRVIMRFKRNTAMTAILTGAAQHSGYRLATANTHDDSGLELIFEEAQDR